MKPSPSDLDPAESFETATPAAVPKGGPGRNGEAEIVENSDLADLESAPETPGPRTYSPPPLPAPSVQPRSQSRTLPYSLEAEEHVLSACLIDDGATLAKCIDAKLRPDSFYDPKHGIVFETLLAMHAGKLPIDAATLAQELTDRRKLDAIGGYAFIVQVSGRAATTIQAAYFIEKVKEQATLREIIRAATSAVEDCYGYSGDLEILTDDLKRRLTFAIDGTLAKDDWPRPVPSDEFCENPPPTPPELIEGILYVGGTMLLAGPSKSHKTFSALDVGIAIASGEKWLGHKTNKSPVLYLNLELQDFASADRISKISAARGHKPPHDLKIWNLRGHTITLAALTAQLPIMIKEHGAKVVCIDPHYKVSAVSDMEENSNDSQGKLLTLLEGLCLNAGAALILTHHFAKGDSSVKNAIDRASGGGVFARWGDVMMTFTPHEDEDCMTVEMALRNFSPIEPFVVRWIYPRWQRDDEMDPKELKRAGGKFAETITAADLLDALGDATMTPAEWIKAAGISRSSFYRKRQELVDLGKVVQFGGLFKKATSP